MKAFSFTWRIVFVLAFVLAGILSRAFGDDAASTDDADARYTVAIEEANAKLLKAIETAIRQATTDGDFDLVAKLAEERKAFTQNKTPPSSAPVMQARIDWIEVQDDAFAKLVTSYEEKIRSLTMREMLDEATTLSDRLKQIKRQGGPPQTAPADQISLPPDLQAKNESVQDRVSKARAEVLETLDRLSKTATSRGDLDKVQSIQQEQEKLDSTLNFESSDATVNRLLTKHRNLIDRDLVQRRRAFETAIREALRDNDTKSATSLTVELYAGQQATDDRWQVLFSGKDASSWNTTSNQWDAFARKVEQARPEIKFLRLRRIDDNSAVIIPITNEQLDKRFDQDNIGWSGDAPEYADVQHLGVFRKDVQPNKKGYVVVGRDGFTGYTGWGFGHRHNIDDGVACVWDGRPIEATRFEIAVTSGPLNISERKQLQIRD